MEFAIGQRVFAPRLGSKGRLGIIRGTRLLYEVELDTGITQTLGDCEMRPVAALDELKELRARSANNSVYTSAPIWLIDAIILELEAAQEIRNK